MTDNVPLSVAQKIIRLSDNDPHRMKYQKRELQFYIDLMKRGDLDHLNIIRYYAFVEYNKSQEHHVFMELCDYTLEKLMKCGEWGEKPHAFKRHVISGICEGVQYLHRHRIIHRDINPANILIKEEGSGFPTVKISDFNVYALHAALKPEASHTVGVGHSSYQAIEVRQIIDEEEDGVAERERAKYGCSADIWSIGAIGYEISTNTKFCELTDRQIRKNKELRENAFNIAERIMKNIGDQKLQQFLYKCLRWDPSKQASCDELLSNEFLVSKQPTDMTDSCQLDHETSQEETEPMVVEQDIPPVAEVVEVG